MLILVLALIFGPPRLLQAQVQECVQLDFAGWPAQCLGWPELAGDARVVYFQATGVEVPQHPTVDRGTRRICIPGSTRDVPSAVTQAALRAACDARVSLAAAATAEAASYQQATSQGRCDEGLAEGDATIAAAFQSATTVAQVKAALVAELQRLRRCQRELRRRMQ